MVKKKGKNAKKAKDPEKEALEARRKELIERAKYLTNEIDREKKEKKEFRLRLQEVEAFWSTEKKNLELKKAYFQEKDYELKEIGARHQSQVDTIKEQIKHQLYQQQNELIQAKNNDQIELFTLRDENAQGTTRKISNVMEYQSRLRSASISQSNFLIQLRREHDDRVMELQNDYKRRFQEVTTYSERNLKSIREEKEEEMTGETKRLEEGKERRIRAMEKMCEERLSKISVEYKIKLHHELDRIQQLKKELATKRKALRQAEKTLKETELKNMTIVEPFKQVKVSLEKLDIDTEEFKVQNRLLEQKKSDLKQEEGALKEMQWKHEVIYQKSQLLEKKRDDLKQNVYLATLQAQQRDGFNAMLLSKKTQELNEVGREYLSSLATAVAKAKTTEVGAAKYKDISEDHSAKKNVSVEDLEGILSKMKDLHDLLLVSMGSGKDQMSERTVMMAKSLHTKVM